MSQQQQQQQKHNVAIDVAQQIGNKQPPSNQQVSEMMDKTHQFIEEKKADPRASAQTVKTMSDFQDVLHATEQLNKNKNQDELLQDVILQTGAAGQDMVQAGKGSLQDPKLQQKGQEAKQQGKQLTQAVWSVLRSMLQSADFRTQVSSLVGIMQEMFAGSESSGLQSETPGFSQQPQLSTQLQHQTGFEQQPIGLKGHTAQMGYDQPIGVQGQTTQMGLDQTFGMQGQTTQQWSQQGSGLSEEKKRELANQFLNVLRKLNESKDVRLGFQQLNNIFKDLTSDDYITGSAPHQQVLQTIQQSENVDQAFNKSKQLIERFSERPLDPFLVKNRELFQYIRNHQQARDWFDRFTGFLGDCFENPHQINDYEFTKRSEDLVNEANELTRDPQLRSRYTQVLSETKAIIYSIKEDPDLKNLQESTSRFLDNFTTVDSNGQRQFNTNLMKELQSFMVPLFLAQLDEIPLPPQQGSNQDYDYYFDNITLYGKEILPDNVKVHFESNANINVQGLTTDQGRARLFFEISSIQMKLSQVHFKFTRKTFPKISDEGIANLKVEGDQGFSLRIETAVEMNDQGNVAFHLKNVDADIQKLKIEILEAQHEFLLKIFAMFYQTRLKLMIEENIEKKIREVFSNMEDGINKIFARYPPSRLKATISQKANDALNSQQQQQAQAMQS